MKLSSNSIGILIFTLLAAAVFFFMAKRPAVEGNVLNFGMPMQSQASSTPPETPTPKVEEDTTSVATDNAEPVKEEPKETVTEEIKSEKVKTESAEPVENTDPAQEEAKQEPAPIEDASGTTATDTSTTN